MSERQAPPFRATEVTVGFGLSVSSGIYFR